MKNLGILNRTVMTQEDKQLLLRDLSARLPYGVKVQVADYKTPVELSHINTKNGNGRKPYCFVFAFEPERVKPYLRPMSSMTEEDRKEYELLANHCIVTSIGFIHLEATPLIDWLNARHFDFRNLIERGLAIEVTEQNNPYKG